MDKIPGFLIPGSWALNYFGIKKSQDWNFHLFHFGNFYNQHLKFHHDDIWSNIVCCCFFNSGKLKKCRKIMYICFYCVLECFQRKSWSGGTSTKAQRPRNQQQFRSWHHKSHSSTFCKGCQEGWSFIRNRQLHDARSTTFFELGKVIFYKDRKRTFLQSQLMYNCILIGMFLNKKNLLKNPHFFLLRYGFVMIQSGAKKTKNMSFFNLGKFRFFDKNWTKLVSIFQVNILTQGTLVFDT